jgi:anti-repressor protein
MDNKLISINSEDNNITISGRALHDALEVKTAYKDWFPRMVGYGFTEGTDFSSILSRSSG